MGLESLELRGMRKLAAQGGFRGFGFGFQGFLGVSGFGFQGF